VVSGDQAIRAFQRAGWVVLGQVGSHVGLTKEGEVFRLSVPRHRELDRGLLRALVKTAGLTVEEFVALLRR
jgi:predicted RNA binding protein YcfA (HicA-like mRNA interferase family)